MTAMSSLSPSQRETIILAEYEEMSLEEIVRVMEAEAGAVKSRLYPPVSGVRR
jgi:DNA-directed RNA polymerase specialized sigma24 family protein